MREKEFQSLVEEVCNEQNIEKEILLKIMVLYEEAQDSDYSFYINPLKELDIIDWALIGRVKKNELNIL